jgi:hypothetical protein
MSNGTTPPKNPFQTGQQFSPSDIVTSTKLENIVNQMITDYPELAQLIMSSGSSAPNALIRFQNNQLQLRNADTGLWHSIWIIGQPGEEEIAIGLQSS